jgi:putative transposase
LVSGLVISSHSFLKPQEHVQSWFDDQVQGDSGVLWAYITGTVDQELLLRNEYLAAENRIVRAQFKGRLVLSDAEKATLAEIAHRLGRKALEELSAVAKPDTLLAWYRKLIAKKFDGSKLRKSWGGPRVDEETERVGGADGEGKSWVGL